MTGHQVVEGHKKTIAGLSNDRDLNQSFHSENSKGKHHTVHVPTFSNMGGPIVKQIGQSIDVINVKHQQDEDAEEIARQNKQTLEQAAGLYYSQITTDSAERVSGFPMPELYN